MNSTPSSGASGALLVVAGVILIAQTLVGGLVDRILGNSGTAPVTGAGSGPGGSGPLPAPAPPKSPSGTVRGDIPGAKSGPLGPMGSKPL